MYGCASFRRIETSLFIKNKKSFFEYRRKSRNVCVRTSRLYIVFTATGLPVPISMAL